ncbi:unnamed protein product [Schistosoma margrebowiei]|uniref:SRCR domain-containing protein n=1 Tax=Schistosoma margrebowiei TaxID=48269 RepID=A0AA85ANY4_9TREM|nr:unnamed protein product [Schistosoma margrebowiei]
MAHIDDICETLSCSCTFIRFCFLSFSVIQLCSGNSFTCSQWFHFDIYRISSWINNNIHQKATLYIHNKQYLYRDNYDLYLCRYCITNVSWKMVRTNYFFNCGYHTRNHSLLLGCKITNFNKKIEDNLVYDLLCICGNWVDFSSIRGDICYQGFTSCKLGLFVRRNVYCDYLHNLLCGELSRATTVFYTVQCFPLDV